jgi:ribosomal protein S18 acetylase RimI-like enzyme
MKITKASLKDAKGIANVLVKGYNIKSIMEGVDVFKNEVSRQHHYIIAKDKGRVIGLATWVMHGLPKHELFELDRIAVLPECRGKGISQKLFHALVKDAKQFYSRHKLKARKLYLMTHVDNTRACKFYEKLGFKHETTLKEHYYEGKDERVYSMFF